MLVADSFRGDGGWRGSCRGADAALGSAVFEEALLDGVEFSLMAMPSMVRDLCAFGLEDGDEAGVDEVAVEEDGAGSAFAFAAAFFGAG